MNTKIMMYLKKYFVNIVIFFLFNLFKNNCKPLLTTYNSCILMYVTIANQSVAATLHLALAYS